jgi:hypothetical protein
MLKGGIKRVVTIRKMIYDYIQLALIGDVG